MKRPLVILLFFVLGMVSVFAGTTGSIMGFVLDKDTGVPIENAKVTIVQTGLSTSTDASGMFLIAGLTVGKYSILVEKVGYQSVSVKDIFVSIDQTTTLSIEMKSSPVEIKNPIVVSASRLLVNKEQAGMVMKMDHSQIVDMNSRDIFRAAQVAPGVVSNEDGQMKIRGTRENNTIFLLDGLSIMDPFHNTFGAVVNAKAIMGEVDVITGKFDAEYGNALGGVINTVSKTPETKKYKVVLSFDTAKALPNWFGDVEKYRKLGEEEYNFDFEGPVPIISNNKLGFIFTGQIFKANSSTHSGYQNEKYEEFHDYHLKFDYKISATDRLAYHTQYGFAWIRLKHRYESLGYTGWPVQYQFNRFHHLLYNRSISADTYFKLALSWFQSGINFGAHDVDTATGEDKINEVKPFNKIGAGDYPGHQRSRSINNEIRFDLASERFTGHKMKVGFDIQRIHTDLYWGVVLLDPAYIDIYGWDVLYPYYFYLEDHVHEYYQTNGYVEDKWNITDKLLLSYGLRFDHWGYLEKNNLKFQPRLGMTYSLSPTTVVRGNFSIKYQAPPVEAVYEEDSGASWYLGYDFDWGSYDIKPEGATDVEIGLQQALGKTLSLDVSVYKKWLNDVVSTLYDPKTDKEEYSNIGKAYSRGLEILLQKSFSNMFSGSLSYTLMEAKGKNMSYRWSDEIGTEDPNYGKWYYLDFDQRHTLNASLIFKTKNAKANLIMKYGSGYPYTPHDEFYDYGRDGTQAKDANNDGDYDDISQGDIPPDTDGSEGDGIYEEGEPTYASDPAAVWNSKRYPAYERVDFSIAFRLPMNWFGAKYWFNLTIRNMFNHKNLRGAGGNNSGDLDPYTGKPWSYATGGTPRRYTWGLKVEF